jgi:thiol-disulfide isomerase/thioredoxin
MKRLSLLLLSLSIFSCQQKEEKPDYSIIKGKVENNTAETALIQGHDFEARIPISEDGTFTDTLRLKKDGLYQIFIGRERTGVYLEKGQNLELSLNADEFDETLKYSGDLGSSNNFLAEKYLWEETNTDYKKLYSLSEEDFFKQLDSDQKRMDSLYATHQIKNEMFDKMLKEDNIYSRAALIENYQDAHRYYSGVEDYQVGSDFYNDLKGINYQDTLAFRNSMAYRSLLEIHYNRVANDETYESGNDNHTLLYLKKVDSALPDGFAKDNLMMGHLQFWLKPDETLDEAYEIYKNSNPDPENLAELTQRYNQLKSLTAGNDSPTFDYENFKGGTTSLADLKGKYVYIDVWATWCGPCLREIPSLKEVEKDYSGKNIQIVSISIDEEKDYDKWKQMVKDKSLGGMQLMADNNWNSKFVKDYAILGIPRFILLDPKGQIVSADAPRPSDPELRKMLDALL